MVNTLRHFSKPIMLVITVVIIVSFTVWGPNMGLGGGGGTVMMVYGKPVTVDQWTRQQRKFKIYAQMGGMYARSLDPAAGQGQMSGVGIANSIVFEHEADLLGISVTPDEQRDAFLSMPAFQGDDGHFSPAAFENFVVNAMNPAGYSKDQISEFLTGEVRIRRVRALVGASIAATPAQIRQQAMERQMKHQISYVELKREDFAKSATVTPEEVKKRYDDQKALFMSLPERKVRYAAFLLPPLADGKPLEEDKRTEQLQKLADRAYEFRESLNLKGANFEELAKKAGAKVGVTAEFFDQNTGPKELEEKEAAAEAAFTLTKDAPYSAALNFANGMEQGAYVLAYGEEKAPEQMTFEAVKARIETDLKSEKAGKDLQAKATEVRQKLEEAKKAGKSFYEAAETLGYKPVQFPEFGGNLPFPQNARNAREIVTAASKLAPGQLSDVLPLADGSAIAHLDQRTAGEEKELDKPLLDRAARGIESQLHYYAFVEWISSRARAAGVNMKELSMR